MIVTVGGIKGGSGKTTVATNFAVLRASAGRRVLLIDADDQETASDFAELRTANLYPNDSGFTCIKLQGTAVRTETLKLKSSFDDVIIDTGGRDTSSQRAALVVSDRFVAPFVPRSFDLWTLQKVGEIVDESQIINPNLVGFVFLNKADPRGSDNSEAAELLKEVTTLLYINTPLGARKAFSNAAAQGSAVTELLKADPKAIQEMLNLEQAVFEENI
jgi:chromosome partitioning protein